MRKRVAIYFGMRITRILEKGNCQIFLEGERKVSFWKNRERIKEKMGSFGNEGSFKMGDFQQAGKGEKRGD